MRLTPEQRRLVNLDNARRSTGPKTAEGKARARGNALKHGLRAETLPLPHEDPAVIAERNRAWNDYYQPESPMAHHLVNACVQATLLHDRCTQHHHAIVTKQVREAQEQWDRNHLDEVEALKKRLDDDPAEAVRLLKRSSFGCAWMLERWDQLGLALETQGRWSPEDLDQAFRLLGIQPEAKKDYAAQLDPAMLRAMMAEQCAELNAEQARLWTEFEAPDRAEAADRALLPHDPTEARLFLRYYAEARTGFHRACRDLNRLLTEGEPSSYPAVECPLTLQEPEVEDGCPVETATASEPAPIPVAEVSPNEPNGAPVAEAAPEEPRQETRIEASPVSPNEATKPSREDSPNEATRPREGGSPNEPNRVPNDLVEGGLDGPSGSVSDWFGLPTWPGAAPAGHFPGPESLLF
jgi:hypothetical protein